MRKCVSSQKRKRKRKCFHKKKKKNREKLFKEPGFDQPNRGEVNMFCI